MAMKSVNVVQHVAAETPGLIARNGISHVLTN